jgi:DNA-binding CsgD family transcriptional regulator
MPCEDAEKNLQFVTDREREIIKLMAEGYRDKEIAVVLRINEGTVKENRLNLMKKFDARSKSSIIEYALETGLITHYEVLESRFSRKNPRKDQPRA